MKRKPRLESVEETNDCLTANIKKTADELRLHFHTSGHNNVIQDTT